jgi:hypothetical protein
VAAPTGTPGDYDPSLPLTPDQQRRLRELLQKYVQDQVTPAEYHEQRARIITNP